MWPHIIKYIYYYKIIYHNVATNRLTFDEIKKY